MGSIAKPKSKNMTATSKFNLSTQLPLTIITQCTIISFNNNQKKDIFVGAQVKKVNEFFIKTPF